MRRQVGAPGTLVGGGAWIANRERAKRLEQTRTEVDAVHGVSPPHPRLGPSNSSTAHSWRSEALPLISSGEFAAPSDRSSGEHGPEQRVAEHQSVRRQVARIASEPLPGDARAGHEQFGEPLAGLGLVSESMERRATGPA